MNVDETIVTHHCTGDTAYLHRFVVPRRLRGCGVGRDTFQRWLATLPAHVTRVELESSAAARGFWVKMGFSDVPDTTRRVMVMIISKETEHAEAER